MAGGSSPRSATAVPTHSSQPRERAKQQDPSSARGCCCQICSSSPTLPAQGYGRTCSRLAVAKGLQGFEVLLPPVLFHSPRHGREREREKLLCPRDCSAQDTAWIKIWSAEVLKCQRKQEGSAGGEACSGLRCLTIGSVTWTKKTSPDKGSRLDTGSNLLSLQESSSVTGKKLGIAVTYTGINPS